MPNSARSWSDLTKNLIVLIALLTLVLNFIVQSARSDNKTRNDKVSACSRIYQDRINEATINATVSLDDLVVAVASTNPDRQSLVDAAVADLASTADLAKRAVTDKAAWNANGNPLPCPI